MIKKQLKKAPFSISGFTLVELIVVISILVILGTISFISFSGYLSTSRDSKRISNTAVITKGFDIALIVGSPINTSKTATGYNIAIAGTGLTMTGYYGVVTDSLLQSIKVFGKDIATYDGFQEYRYSYFPNEKKFQVLSTLENIDNAKSTFIIPSLIDQAFAATAMGYAYIKGNFTATGGIDTIVVDGATWNGTVPTAATVNGITTFTGGQTAIAAAPIAVVAGVSQPAPGIC
jgi:prepilin-type N-terminal cleavage/methylation domain-containing protein